MLQAETSDGRRARRLRPPRRRAERPTEAGWIVLEVWVAEPGNAGTPPRFSAAQAYCTESGREALS